MFEKLIQMLVLFSWSTNRHRSRQKFLLGSRICSFKTLRLHTYCRLTRVPDFGNSNLILSVVVFAVRLCRVCRATLSTFLWVVVSRWCSGRDVRLAQREAGKLRWLMVCTEHRTDPTGEQRDEGESLGSLLSWEFDWRKEEKKSVKCKRRRRWRHEQRRKN